MTDKVVDVDASWDGKGSLDDHRQKAFAEIQQPGFGIQSDKAKARDVAIEPAVTPVIGDDDNGE